MRFPDWLQVYGPRDYRGPCDREETDQVNFFSWLACDYPEWAKIALHPKNESKRTWGAVNRDKRSGALNTGASDVIIPCGFAMEIKRKDHTKSSWQKGQQDYLIAAKNAGCFVCVGLGFEGAKLGFLDWLERTK